MHLTSMLGEPFRFALNLHSCSCCRLNAWQRKHRNQALVAGKVQALDVVLLLLAEAGDLVAGGVENGNRFAIVDNDAVLFGKVSIGELVLSAGGTRPA